MEQTERLLRLDEAARTLGVSLSMFKRLRKEGKVRIVKIGRRAVRVNVREIERLCSREE